MPWMIRCPIPASKATDPQQSLQYLEQHLAFAPRFRIPLLACAENISSGPVSSSATNLLSCLNNLPSSWTTSYLPTMNSGASCPGTAPTSSPSIPLFRSSLLASLADFFFSFFFTASSPYGPITVMCDKNFSACSGRLASSSSGSLDSFLMKSYISSNSTLLTYWRAPP